MEVSIGKPNLKKKTNSLFYLTITPSINKIGTSSTFFSEMELALKMNFLSYKVFPIKKVTINSLVLFNGKGVRD